MARGVDGRDIFVDDNDRLIFLRALTEVHSKLPFTLFAYCLMGNHFHFAIRAKDASLSRIMHRLLTKYSLTFNSKHGRSGHLFQARYKAVLCLDEMYLASLVRYIHLNPVRAGMTNRAEEWPWSSVNPRPWIIGTDILPPATRKLWESPDADELAVDAGFEPWPALDAEWTPSLLRNEGTPDIPLETIASDIAERHGIVVSELTSRSRRRLVSNARREAARTAIREGHRPIDIARYFGVTPSVISRCFAR